MSLRTALALLFTCVACASVAQVRAGLRAGVSLSADGVAVESFTYDTRSYRLSVDDVRAGLHVGAFLQARLGKIVLQPELLLHATRTDYYLEELLTAQTLASIRTERVSTIELPVLVAYRWGALRLQAGPVARSSVAQSSELLGIADYRYAPDRVAIGYQAGIGLDIRRFLLDIKYDGSFDAGGSAVDIGGQRLDLSQGRNRTYLTLGWAMFGGRG